MTTNLGAPVPSISAGLTVTLSPDQEAQYHQGGYPDARLVATLCKELEHAGITAPVVILLSDGRIAFALTASHGRPR